jgi:hypothetical protein
MQDISYKGIWFEQERRSKTYRALIYANGEEIEKIKKKIPSSDILSDTADYIYITGNEKETENDSGVFGF